jgi:nucleotidyltransferase substrate binding protein (TIGR01987 family)
MGPERLKELERDFSKAYARLGEAVREDLNKGSIVIDGAIQRFEFTFELAWKLLRARLQYNGIEADTPRSAIKEAFKARMITDGDGWIDMLEDRNRTSHIYDEKAAAAIYKKICAQHYSLLGELVSKRKGE